MLRYFVFDDECLVIYCCISKRDQNDSYYGGTGPLLHPTTHRQYPEGGRVGEWAGAIPRKRERFQPAL